jgi:hypothetical protein
VPTAPLPSVSPEDETTPIVVRTLKDPPEIWDLVHEAPRNFNARSAFLTRIGSRKGAVVAAAALILVIGAGSAGAVFFKDKLRWPSPQAPAPKAAAATVPGPVVKKTATQTDATVPTADPAAPTDVAPEASGATELPSVIVGAELNTFPGNRRLRSRSSSMASTVNDEQPAVGTSVAPPTVASPKPAARLSAETDPKKQTAPANSQVVAPPKMAPPKGKVIQWP